MRTIKFRGKSCSNGDWFYGNLYDYDKDGRTHICGLERGCLNIDPNTIGQFTGLLDKNGKEIYEGDIVKTKGNWGGVVTWNSRGYYYIKDKYYYDNEEPDLSPLGSLHCYERKQLEIIGNIHDNPELLKGGSI